MINGGRTTIALEPQFWTVADKLSKTQGICWQVWASNKLTKAQSTKASTLRVAILEIFIVAFRNQIVASKNQI